MQYNLTKRFAKISLATLLLSMGHSFCANAAGMPTSTSSSTTITPHNSSTHAASVTTTTSVVRPKPASHLVCIRIVQANNHLNSAWSELVELESMDLDIGSNDQKDIIKEKIKSIRGNVKDTLGNLNGLVNCPPLN
jgi:hypothetical protein